MSDAFVLEVLAQSNEYLNLQERLQQQLRAGRAAIAFSRIDRSFVGVNFYYAPRKIIPTVFLESTSVPAESTALPSISDAAARESLKTAACTDPVAWFGPNVSGLAYTAQAHFKAAIAICVDLRAAKSRLESLLTERANLRHSRAVSVVLALESNKHSISASRSVACDCRTEEDVPATI